MALVENIKVKAELVGYGAGALVPALGHTPDASGSFQAAVNAGAADSKPVTALGALALSSSTTVEGCGVNIDGVVASSVDANQGTFMLGNDSRLHGGRITNSGRSQAIRSEGNKAHVRVQNTEADGTFVAPASLPAYAYDFYDVTDLVAQDLRASGYTGGLSLTRTTRAIASALNFRNMLYHPSLVAGGYGVLMQGAKNTLLSQVQFKSQGDGTGRHGLYISQVSGSTCVNTVATNLVFDYSEEPDAIQPPGGINIRACDRTIIGDAVLDGTGVTGNTENGNIGSLLVHSLIINKFKRSTGIAYAVTLGDDTGGNRVRNSLVQGCIIGISQKPGSSSDFMYAVVCSGQDNAYIGNITRIPDAGQPYLVRAGTSGVLIQGGLDTGPALGSGLPFIQFDGAASNISILGCKTNRPWFRTGNLAAVTDLTVDFPRACGVAVNSGTASTADTWELISSVNVGTSSVTITFNSHVTAAAVAQAIVSDRPASSLCRAQVLSVSAKNLTLQFISTTGTIINPSTTTVAANITLNS